MRKAVFQLEPLTCPSCIKKIETTLLKTSGVESVKVLFNSSKVRTEFDESIAKADGIEEVLENLGFAVVGKKVS